jgi:hypothetical protein
MIRIGIKQGLLGEGPTHWRECEWRRGITVAQLCSVVQQVVPARVLVGIDGRQVETSDEEVPDGATVLVVGAPGYEVLGYVVYAIISAVVSLGINYLVSLLVSSPKPPGLGQDRGEEQSPTYSWDAIQTSRGQGLPIAAVLGEHAVGGQVIDSRVRPTTFGQGELLMVVLALCEGPIFSIGGYQQATNQLGRISGQPYPGQPNWLGLPAGLYINDNLQDTTTTTIPDVEAWTRIGTLNQSALPSTRFGGASSLFNVPASLNDAGDAATWTYSGSDAISSFWVSMIAPGGVYAIAAGGGTAFYSVSFEVSWKRPADTSWQPLQSVAGAPSLVGSGTTPGLTFGAEFVIDSAGGSFQVRIERLTPAGGVTTTISGCTLRSIELIRKQEFAYPGIALLGLAIRATGTVSGTAPQIKTTLAGSLVRVWDSVFGFSPRAWLGLGGVWVFATNPGRNPAWLLGEFATNRRFGMGNELGDDRVNWQRLREWAAFCQTEPTGWGEPGFECALVLDSQRPAWETVQAICQAGRATPIWEGGRLSVVYQYRDAHGDGGVSVPAKVPVQLITSALCSDVVVRWLPRKGRATAIDFQFLDREQGYAQNVVTVEDSESSINDPSDPQSEPYLVASQQAYGITRRTQLIRHGYFLHRTARLVRRELSFVAGPWLLAVQVGDLFDFQHDMLRPYSDNSFGVAAQQMATDVVDSNTVLIDRKVVGSGLWFAARQPDGAPVYREITAIADTTYRGRLASVLTLAGDPITLSAGAACVVGEADKLVQTYQVVAITLGQDMRRTVKALQWAPEVFDDVPPEAGDKGASSATIGQKALDSDDTTAEGVEVSRGADGAMRVSWQRPSTGDVGTVARVYARPDFASVWILLGETAGTDLSVQVSSAWRQTEVAVVIQGRTGGWMAPDAAAPVAVQLPEFPALLLPAPSNVVARANDEQNELALSWSRSDAANVVAYEVREGRYWASARVLYRGSDPGTVLRPAPALGVLQVAAIHQTGMPSRRATVQRAVTALPYAGAQLESETEYAPTIAGGTHSGTKWTDPFIELATASYQGTFTTAAQVFDYEAPRLLRCAFEVRELDNATFTELDGIGVGSGEAFWRTLDVRPPSIGTPGINWELTWDDIGDATFDDLPDLTAGGQSAGEVGQHCRARLESRTYTGGAWSDWTEHRDRLAVCSEWQARVLLGRRELARSIRVVNLKLQALI